MKLKDKNFLVLVVILTLSATLRFYNLETIPYWHWDEGVNLNIAWNLMQGKLLWFNLTFPFVPHPPLFFTISGALLKIFGNELLIARFLNVVFGLLSVFLIYLISRKIFNEKIALLSSFFLAIYPSAIYFSRMNFANNLLMLLALLALYFSFKFLSKKEEKWLLLTSVVVGLGMLTEYTGIALFISLIVLLWLEVKEKRKIIFSFLVPSSMFLIFVGIMLILMPQAFLHDLSFQLERFRISFWNIFFAIGLIFFLYWQKGKIKILLQNILYAYTFVSLSPEILKDEERRKEMFRRNLLVLFFLAHIVFSVSLLAPLSDDRLLEGVDYFWLGIFGLFLVKNEKVKNVLLLFLLPLFLLILKLDRSDHMLIPLYPFFSIGLSIFLYKIYRFFGSIYVPIPFWKIFVIILLSYPFLGLLYQDVNSFVLKKNLAQENIQEKKEVAEFINEKISLEDFVIADSHLIRFIQGRTSVLLQSIAIEGIEVAYMAPDYSTERFVFNCSYKNAKFIVLKEKDMEWLEENNGEIAEEIKKWVKIHKTEFGDYYLYRNPKKDPKL